MVIMNSNSRTMHCNGFSVFSLGTFSLLKGKQYFNGLTQYPIKQIQLIKGRANISVFICVGCQKAL